MTNEFNRDNLKSLRKDVQAALDEVAKKHGIKLDLGNIRFTDSQFTSKVIGTVINQKAVEKATGPIKMGTEFISQGRKFTVCDYKPSRWKYPFTGMSVRGARYKFTEEDVRRGMVA